MENWKVLGSATLHDCSACHRSCDVSPFQMSVIHVG